MVGGSAVDPALSEAPRAMAPPPGLIALTARQAVDLLGRGEVSPLELVDAAAARIEATDGALNALPTLCLDRARDHARRIASGAAGAPAAGPWLGGLPIAVKDLTDVAGVRTTYGSPIYADHVPERSDLLVERLEERGAIVIGKSNTPEFGAGANTFNEVFGETRNPWNTALTPAGSSGGSAAALAAGQVWLATGSDLGGQPAHAGELLLGRRASAEPGSGRPRPQRAAVRHAVGRGPDGPDRRRRRAHARRHGRRASGRPAVHRRTGRVVPGRRRRSHDRPAGSPSRPTSGSSRSTPRWPRSAPRRPAGSRSSGAGVDRRLPRPRRRAGDFTVLRAVGFVAGLPAALRRRTATS